MANIETAGMSRALPYIGMAVVVLANVIGTAFIKLGASAGSRPLFGTLSWSTLVGLGIFGTSVLLYTWVLKHLPLYMAQSIAALQFMGIVLVAAFFFDEAISVRQYLGFALILAGLFVIVR